MKIEIGGLDGYDILVAASLGLLGVGLWLRFGLWAGLVGSGLGLYLAAMLLPAFFGRRRG